MVGNISIGPTSRVGYRAAARSPGRVSGTTFHINLFDFEFIVSSLFQLGDYHRLAAFMRADQDRASAHIRVWCCKQ